MRMRKITAALAIAAMLAAGLGTATLEAKPRPGNSATCEYLKAIMDYTNTHPSIYVWAAALYKKLGCGD